MRWFTQPCIIILFYFLYTVNYLFTILFYSSKSKIQHLNHLRFNANFAFSLKDRGTPSLIRWREGRGVAGGRGRGEEEEKNKIKLVTQRRNSNLKPDARYIIIIEA